MTTPIRCVVDTSVCIKQFIPDPLSFKVQQLFAHLAYQQTEIFVPDLFYITYDVFDYAQHPKASVAQPVRSHHKSFLLHWVRQKLT